MANIILAEHGTPTAMTITLAALASSTAGVGRQSTIIDNTNNAKKVHLYVGITVGTTPTIDTNIYVYLIKSDGTLRSDSAGASDAAWTQVNARLLGVIRVPAVTSDIQYQGEFIIRNPGPEWGIGIVHDTGVNLHVTEALSVVRYTTENSEIQ